MYICRTHTLGCLPVFQEAYEMQILALLLGTWGRQGDCLPLLPHWC
jgi:hypothetical protein